MLKPPGVLTAHDLHEQDCTCVGCEPRTRSICDMTDLERLQSVKKEILKERKEVARLTREVTRLTSAPRGYSLDEMLSYPRSQPEATAGVNKSIDPSWSTTNPYPVVKNYPTVGAAPVFANKQIGSNPDPVATSEVAKLNPYKRN